MPDIAHREILADAADPVEFAEIDPDFCRVELRIADGAEVEDVDDGAVLGRGSVEILHRLDAGGSRHVLHDDGRVSRNVTADMAGKQARIHIEPAARRKPNNDGERLASVEILRRCGSSE